MMDPVKIQQVLTNLCVNAREAISGVGNIGIVTDNVSLGASSVCLRTVMSRKIPSM